jgi:dTDP-4-dehydrorhamnose reductase
MAAISHDRPILVIGSAGQLGEAIVRLAQARGLPVRGGDLPDVDLVNGESLKDFFLAARPSVVINAAAFTDVDGAETNQQAALAVNAEGPARLAALCAFAGVPLIHVSTDYVFDGRSSRPYGSDDQVAPLGVYGASKAAGEVGVRASLPNHVIVRTAWLYGLKGKNFARTMLRLAKERHSISVVDDQIGAPTFADDLAGFLLEVAGNITGEPTPEAFGTFHFTNDGATSWCGFAREIFDIAAAQGLKVPEVKAIATTDYPTPATRPPYSVLDCSVAMRVFSATRRSWQEAAREAVPLLLRSQG